MKIKFFKKAEKKWPVFLAVAIFMLLFLFCMNDYNPFEDPTNSRAVFLSGPADGDTVKIFTSDTFTIGLLVPSYLESFSIETDSSRFGDTNFTKINAQGQNQGKYFFRVSYYDTGWHKIRLISVRNPDTQNDAGKVIEERRVYAVSPLNPKPVHGFMGDSILLQTDSVGDHGIIYHWDFGVTSIETPKPISKQVLHLSGTRSSGNMWVLDFTRKFSSPKFKFVYDIKDLTGPEITWKDEYQIPYDTIKVSTSTFRFNVNIIDRGSGVVANATVNDSLFNSFQKTIYTKNLDSLDTLKGPLKLNVKAADEYFNKSQKTFYVIYDTTIKNYNPPKILVEVPSGDNVVTALRNWVISGTLECSTIDSFTMSVSVNSNRYDAKCTVDENNKNWKFTINLPDTANVIELEAYDNQGRKKAEKTITMIYDKNVLDTVPPVIVNMTVDNNPVLNGQSFAENIQDSLRIVAYDKETGIKYVIVNNDTLSKPKDLYVWMGKAKSSHTEPGSRNEIKIIDQSNNYLDTSINVIHNFIPEISYQPKPPLPLLVGSTYIDSIKAKDVDNDRIFYTKNDGVGPKDCRIDSLTGLINWIPAISDTGINMVSIFIHDQFKIVPYSFLIRVVNPSSLSVPVKLMTSEKDFPALIEANKDTIIDTLKILAGTGIPPFTFSVRLVQKDSVIKVTNGVLKWAPSMSDTGYNQLKISVTDSFNRSDVIYPIFCVIPDRGFTLKSNDSTIKDKSGIINLNHSTLPETLIVQIIEPYGINVDNFDVNIKTAGNITKGVIKSGLVKIILNPDAVKEGFDSLVVTVKDGDGNQHSIKDTIFYGTIPEKPQLLSPLNNYTIKDTSALLSWKCSDSDHDSLSYSLYMAGKDNVYTEIAKITDTVFNLKGFTRAETYFWKVVASDRKNSVQSDIDTFSIDPPRRVKFKTSITAFPFFLEALKDSLYFALEVTGSSGYHPFNFSADASGKPLQIVNGNSIKWKPLVQDTGSKVLTVTVKDSAGNFDTLKTVIRIVPPNRPCSLFVSGTDTINMSKLDSQALNCTVLDPDPVFAEHHTVKIIQRNTALVEEVDSTRKFTIRINTDSSSRIYDSLTIILTDRAGHSFTVQKIIYYGKPPVSPYNPSPSQGKLVSDSIINLSWTGGDPDGNDVKYDFYIGTSQNSLVKAGSALNVTSFTDTINKWGNTYYWKIVAKDRNGVTEGPIWSFLLSPNISKVLFNTSITGANIISNVTDIPIAVRLDSTNTDFSQFDSINHDIRFKNSNGIELPVEIQDWNQAKKTALLWVLMDNVNGNSTNQYITMFKGNGQNQSGGQAVFGGFNGVWHMSGLGDTTEKDVSGNNNDGTMVNLDHSNTIDGILGKAFQFNYTRYMDMGNTSSLRFSSRLTIETWVKISPSMAGIEPIVSKGSESAYGLDVNNVQKRFEMTVVYNPGQKRTITSDTVYVADRWYHLAGVFDGDSVSLYINGKRQNSISAFPTHQISISADPFRIGQDFSHPTNYLAGALDEVRVSALGRSSDWIKLSYESQRQGSSLLSFVKTRQ